MTAGRNQTRPWVDAGQLQRRGVDPGTDGKVLRAHPLLDPLFWERPTRLGLFLRALHEQHSHDDRIYRRELHRLLNPPHVQPDEGTDPGALITFLNEADAYILEVIDLLPGEARQHVRPAATVTACNDIRTLMSLILEGDSPRIRFEAQRKLCLAKLLLDVEHSRHVQDGPRHKAYFERLLRDGLWRYTEDTHHAEIGFELDRDGESIRYNLPPRPGQQTWAFHSLFLKKVVGGRPVHLDIYYYNCRFKRSVDPVSYEIIDGRRRVLERVRWRSLRRSNSGSIIAKMIRKGINNPDEIGDLLGAMFIVHEESDLDDLLLLLDDALGSPLSWRNVTDTLASDEDARALNRWSGRGYKVFKGDLDILHPNPDPSLPPYRFTVEIQIYTLEGFLRTVHGAHDASHLALKLRQFLHGLVPKLFPREIYGEGWLRLGGVPPVTSRRQA